MRGVRMAKKEIELCSMLRLQPLDQGMLQHLQSAFQAVDLYPGSINDYSKFWGPVLFPFPSLLPPIIV